MPVSIRFFLYPLSFFLFEMLVNFSIKMQIGHFSPGYDMLTESIYALRAGIDPILGVE